VIGEIICDTVADFAFISLEERQDSVTADSDRLQVILPVKLPVPGYFLLAADQELVDEIAGNVLEVDQPTAAVRSDILSELLNTIAGRVMEGIIPKTVSYELGLPAPVQGKFHSGEEELSYCYRSETGDLIVTISARNLIERCRDDI
jgi:CheY-specific phosphatase CheX